MTKESIRRKVDHGGQIVLCPQAALLIDKLVGVSQGYTPRKVNPTFFFLGCKLFLPKRLTKKKKGSEVQKERIPSEKRGFAFAKSIPTLDDDKLSQLSLHPEFLGVTSTIDGWGWREPEPSLQANKGSSMGISVEL